MSETTEHVFTSTGLVRRLAEAMFTGVPTHPDWAESLAIAIIGMLAGMDRYISNQYGKLRANIMVIYIGASGLSFKTVPLKKVVRPLIKRLTERVNNAICGAYDTTLEEFNNAWSESAHSPAHVKRTKEWKNRRTKLEGIKRRFVDFEVPQRFTSEFLITWLNDHPQGMIVGDEYTKMFKGAKQKDYLTDNMEDLSRLYDCDMEKVGTQTRGVEYPDRAYVSFCSATTYYLLTLMHDEFFIQGTGNRILWILDDEKEPVNEEKVLSEMRFFWSAEEDEDFDQLLDFLVDKLMLIRDLPEIVVTLSFDAGVELDRYRVRKYNEAVALFREDLLDRDANLIARLAQNAMKLALGHCIGRYAWNYDPEDPPISMEISKKDAEWAIEKTQKHYEHYNKIRVVSARVTPTLTRSYISDQQRVLYVIERLKLKGLEATKTKIMQQTGWLKDPCQEILDAMLAVGAIQMQSGIKGNKRYVHYTC